MLTEVLARAQRRDFAGASAIASRALREGFEHPLLLNVLATQLEHEGRYEESRSALAHAVAIAPRDIAARNALALVLLRLNRWNEALAHSVEVIRLSPNLGFAHVVHGDALIGLGRLELAKRSHVRALELEPENFSAMASLASIASHRGQHREATEWAQRTLRRAPGMPAAIIALAAAELASGASERAEALLRQLLGDPRVAARDKVSATGLLGDVYDRMGRYADAFRAYTECNQGLVRLYPEYCEVELLSGYVRRLTRDISALPAGAWPLNPPGDIRAAGHVFLIGFPRSGTTLLEAILDGSAEIASLEENELLDDGVVRYLGVTPDVGGLLRASAQEVAALRGNYWRRVQAAGVSVAGKVFVDKYPLNTLKLPLIRALFPDARILFARRDPRDVLLGCFRRRFRMNLAMFELLTLEGTSELYDSVMDFANLVRSRIDMDWYDVRYEALVNDPGTEMSAICRFVGITFQQSMLDIASRAGERAHATPSTAQLAAGINRSEVGHWRHYRTELAPVLPLAEKWALRLGYPSGQIVVG